MSTPTTSRIWDSGPQPGRDVDTVRDVDGDLWERWMSDDDEYPDICRPANRRDRRHARGGRMTTTTAITEFRGRWAFLSNFHPAVLTWEGITYPTSEHAFNAGKTLDHDQRQWIASAPTPREAKHRGRSVQLRDGWDEHVRFQVMADVLRAKFCCRPERIDALLSTGDAPLVEGNTWHDQTWGDCRCKRPACAKPGGNHLGRLLMVLRAELRGAA